MYYWVNWKIEILSKWCQVVRHFFFFYNLWCLAVNVFLTCDASRGLWHHPVTNDVPSVEDFNKNEKLLAVYSLEDASSLWFFVVKMRVGLGGEDDFAYDATVAPSVMTPVGYKRASHVTTFFISVGKEHSPWLKYFNSNSNNNNIKTAGYRVCNFPTKFFFATVI